MSIDRRFSNLKTSVLAAMVIAILASIAGAVAVYSRPNAQAFSGICALVTCASCAWTMFAYFTQPGKLRDIPRRDEAPPTPDKENEAWLSLVEECVGLFDELDRHAADFPLPQRQLTEHVLTRLQESLERSGVERIEGEGDFDPARHQSDQGLAPDDSKIAGTVSPGFRVGRRVFRRARVRVL